jgi:hypothetical protein
MLLEVAPDGLIADSEAGSSNASQWQRPSGKSESGSGMAAVVPDNVVQRRSVIAASLADGAELPERKN